MDRLRKPVNVTASPFCQRVGHHLSGESRTVSEFGSTIYKRSQPHQGNFADQGPILAINNIMSTAEPTTQKIETRPRIDVGLSFPEQDVSRIQYSLCRKIHRHTAFEQSLAFVFDPKIERGTVELNLDDTPYVYFASVAGKPVVHWLDPFTRQVTDPPDDVYTRLENGGRTLKVRWIPKPGSESNLAGRLAAVELKHERSKTKNWAYFSMRIRGEEPSLTYQPPPIRKPISETMQILPITVDFADDDLQRAQYTNIFDYSRLPKGVDLDLALVVNLRQAPPFCFEFHITDPGVSFHPCGDEHDQVLVRFVESSTGTVLETPPASFHGCRLYDRRTCHVEWRPRDEQGEGREKLWISTFHLKALHARSGKDACIAPRIIHTPTDTPNES